MCFSATASFVDGAALLPAGIYCVRKAVQKNRTYLPLATVPLVFSLQQFCEGLVWVGLGEDNGRLVESASVVYLFLAVGFWPFWIPLSILLTETRRREQVLLAILTIVGLAWTWLYLPIAVQPSRWLVTEVVHHSIHYDYGYLPGFRLAPAEMWRIGYLLIVCGPLVLACKRGRHSRAGRALRLLGGLAIVTAFGVSYFVYWYAFTSVWCFFASLLALSLCYVFYRMPQRQVAEPGMALLRRIGTRA
jgi:hypothetical protein